MLLLPEFENKPPLPPAGEGLITRHFSDRARARARARSGLHDTQCPGAADRIHCLSLRMVLGSKAGRGRGRGRGHEVEIEEVTNDQRRGRLG